MQRNTCITTTSPNASPNRDTSNRVEHRQAAGAVAHNAGQVLMSAFGGKADIGWRRFNVRL